MPLPHDRQDWEPGPLDADCRSRAVIDLIAGKCTDLVLAAIPQGATRNGGLLLQIGAARVVV